MMLNEHESPRYSSGRARRIVLVAGIASVVGSIVMFYVSEWLYEDYSIAKGVPPGAEEMEIGAHIGFFLGIVLIVVGVCLPGKGQRLSGRVDGKRIAPRQSNHVLLIAFRFSLVIFVFMLGLLCSAGAEAFFGDKEPMFQMLGGFIVGTCIAVCLDKLMRWLRRSGRTKIALCIVIAIALFDLAAVPFARWLIRLAYAAPNHVIDLRDLW